MPVTAGTSKTVNARVQTKAMPSLDNKVAIVTGSASGIGAEIARVFVAEGARVVLTDIDVDRGRTHAAALGEAAHFVEQDVSKEASWDAVMTATRDHFGALHILVNNAALVRTASIEDTEYELFRDTLMTNAGSVYMGCKRAIEVMKAHGEAGSLVNIASTTAVATAAWTFAYGMSKAAVLSMTKSIALHCAGSGYDIRCNAVLPGVVMTPAVQQVMDSSPDPEATLAGLKASHPIGRLLERAEVASAVRYLASDESSGMTGAHIAVDGGQTAGSA